jgi:hypothetical protein
MVQVLFSFICHQAQNPVTDDFIASVFNPFGLLVNVSLKRVNISQEKNSQNGYGFVHFCQNWNGVYSAVKCVQWFKKKTVEGVTLDAKFGEQFRRYLHRNQIVSKHDDNFVSPYTAPLEFEHTAIHGVSPQDLAAIYASPVTPTYMSSQPAGLTSAIECGSGGQEFLEGEWSSSPLSSSPRSSPHMSPGSSHLPSAAGGSLHPHQTPLVQQLSHQHPAMTSLPPTMSSHGGMAPPSPPSHAKKLAYQLYTSQLLLQLQQQQQQQQQHYHHQYHQSSLPYFSGNNSGNDSVISEDTPNSAVASPHLRMPSATIAYLQHLQQSMSQQHAHQGTGGGHLHPLLTSGASVSSAGSGGSTMSRTSGAMCTQNLSTSPRTASNLALAAATPVGSYVNDVRIQQQYQYPTKVLSLYEKSPSNSFHIDNESIGSTPTNPYLSHNNSKTSVLSQDRTAPLDLRMSSGHSVMSMGSQGNNSVCSFGSNGASSVGQYSIMSGSQQSYSGPYSSNNSNTQMSSPNPTNCSSYNLSAASASSPQATTGIQRRVAAVAAAAQEQQSTSSPTAMGLSHATSARSTQDYFSKVQQRQAEILELYRQQNQKQNNV